MRLLRPYIPAGVRLVVAYNQLYRFDKNCGIHPRLEETSKQYRQRILKLLSDTLGGKIQLDHDPALENRIKEFDNNGKFVRYIPDANDPNYLIYREKHAHHIKTNVRGDGAQYPDRVLAKRERKRKRVKKKYKWPSRPFPKKKLAPSDRLAKLHTIKQRGF